MPISIHLNTKHWQLGVINYQNQTWAFRGELAGWGRRAGHSRMGVDRGGVVDAARRPLTEAAVSWGGGVEAGLPHGGDLVDGALAGAVGWM